MRSMRTDTIAYEPELLQRYPGWDRAAENGIIALTAEADLRERAMARMCRAEADEPCASPLCGCHDACALECAWHSSVI
jgi:hypothetical protein